MRVAAKRLVKTDQRPIPSTFASRFVNACKCSNCHFCVLCGAFANLWVMQTFQEIGPKPPIFRFPSESVLWRKKTRNSEIGWMSPENTQTDSGKRPLQPQRRVETKASVMEFFSLCGPSFFSTRTFTQSNTQCLINLLQCGTVMQI